MSTYSVCYRYNEWQHLDAFDTHSRPQMQNGPTTGIAGTVEPERRAAEPRRHSEDISARVGIQPMDTICASPSCGMKIVSKCYVKVNGDYYCAEFCATEAKHEKAMATARSMVPADTFDLAIANIAARNAVAFRRPE